MTLKISVLPATLAVLVMITIGTGQVSAQIVPPEDPTPPTDPITVTPLVLQFGTEPVGTSVIDVITLTNNTSETLRLSISGFDGEYEVFSTTVSVIPDLPRGASFDLPIRFSPVSDPLFVGTFLFQGIVILRYDSEALGLVGSLNINLSGRGELQNDPVVAIGDLVLYTAFDLESSDFAGPGKGKSAANRALVFQKWIVKAQTLILGGEFDEAYDLLSAVLLKVDGVSRPPDWVVGTAAVKVADQICNILTALSG